MRVPPLTATRVFRTFRFGNEESLFVKSSASAAHGASVTITHHLRLSWKRTRTDSQSPCLELKACLRPATMCVQRNSDAPLRSFPFNPRSSNDDCWDEDASSQDLRCQSGFLVIVGQLVRPPASHSPPFLQDGVGAMDAPSRSLLLSWRSNSTVLIRALRQNGRVWAAKCVTTARPVLARNCEPTCSTPIIVDHSFCIVPSPRLIQTT